jgi:hypothetical protein
MSRPRAWAVAVALAAAITVAGHAESPGAAAIRQDDLRRWLTYIASDELQGRATYTTGLGLAASYLSRELEAAGVAPGGDNGSYLQTVRVLGVKTTSRSRVVVTVRGQSRTFADGDGVTFPRNMGATQTLTLDHVEFGGYGLDLPSANLSAYGTRSIVGAAVVWLGPGGPSSVTQRQQRLLGGRARAAFERGAVASIGQAAPPAAGRGRAAGPAATAPAPAAGSAPAPASAAPAAGRGAIPAADFTTSQRLDLPVPPAITASDAFFEFLFSAAPVPYTELTRLAAAREPLPGFRLDGVTVRFEIDATYQVVRTQLSQNVVAIVKGRDRALRERYVAFGAHYDHVGYAEGEVAGADGAARRAGAPGVVTRGAEQDRIWNGADDDGSGTVALLALARAFAKGPRPRRSLLFVWHTGEERGLLGSRYFADYPTVPLDRIDAQLNVDMIGRNRDDKPAEANTVYPVGSDRISSDLDAVLQAANTSLRRPLTLDYALNDATDPEQIYYRSDHYSYAAKGIPIVFFTTNLHPDYHANTDDVGKIEFEKLWRVTGLIYETGLRLANRQAPLVRDRRGPRATSILAPARAGV